ncbi:hypothetical protein [Vitiosangium sp. GDMCC 1.1324]|uniref:hypothetical protein n=1 Tax=Vitiosangium sp. (strain GDMCC 1.1324) TaxID=2138576 RepID=UPI000D3449F7|nr:hypothetical protein [Vitiosangium sp. GDMCC 1.1324]PTL79676.1 hypothetical protein DAT35_33275 [Vitiosangium sp. GDMCC 1.1324]
MNRRKAPLLLALVLLIAASALLVFKTRSEEGAAPETAAARTQAKSDPQALTARARGSTAGTGTSQEGEDGAEPPAGDLVSYLRSRYGAHIRDPHTQMRMLEQLMRHFQKLNPTGWEADLLAVLKQAFPELYDELAQRLHQRLDYERWVKEHHAELRDKPEKERRAALWEERNQLFGKEVAEKIWAAELRNFAVADSLASIDALPNATVQDRMAQYKQNLTKTYGEHTQAYVQAHQQELMNRFLDLGSVQKDLGTMTPELRAENLRSIRKEMGLDEQALQRWNELDKVRDTRWELGSQYMSERELLAQQYSGTELEARLTELRSRYFSDEAQTIAEEEESGFFRFTRPRQWGRN